VLTEVDVRDPRAMRGVSSLGSHPEPYGYIVRSLVAGDSLFTISWDGIEERRLATLDRVAWAAFPSG
jgi:hypothetical protein